jgi:hypothetical protein
MMVSYMCKQCDRLKLTIDSGADIDRLNQDILNLYDCAHEMLGADSGGSLREDVDLAGSNLARMYEVAAPLCLVRKAHAIHRLRLRKLGPSKFESNSPAERRARFTAIQGDKIDE